MSIWRFPNEISIETGRGMWGTIYSNRCVNPGPGGFPDDASQGGDSLLQWEIVPEPRKDLTRIGLFGGTFDPPHVGHLVTAVNVRHALDLDVVVLMVANVPWQKDGTREITPAQERYRMVAAAVDPVAGLVPGRHEIDQGGHSYTADTLELLGREHPHAELFTIVGDDAAAGLHSWDRSDEVIRRSRLVVVDRPGAPVELDSSVEWIRVEVPRLDVSSTDLRERFTDGRPLDYLVTDATMDVIESRALYGVGAT